MDQIEDDFDAVLDRAIGGDTGALGELLARIHPMVVRYCRSRLSDGHRSLSTADDVAQEVCMAVLTALPKYRREGRPFLAFVYGIAGNKVVDAHRSASRSRSHPVAEVPDVVSEDADPEELAMKGAVTTRMLQLLDQLPSNQREILSLRIGAGLTAEETAEALSTTPGAVRVAQHRALAKLRSILEADAGLTQELL
ncbi:sigma-70 family RNA polymerase sigma factor [Nakamurella antarctica]|uniref:Sigma-70 family RNA polymerase sigma factor n=1 Tax=Nakamurella antarctica TaxID=1902245 RepID=A0A3G8ZND0_9ACTN|nr:sigma-70 family RNA polymerase sigma factor [Nakamurella antarctica]AZI58648.1 sigma-70 family RNA polymerase sigma factor [Nakamurella antarctica]